MLQENSLSRTVFSIIVSILFAFSLPLVTKYYLNADIGLFPLLFIIFAVAGPVFLNKFLPGEHRWNRNISAAVVTILAVCILVLILITPLSAYTRWFESFREGAPEGAVGTIFVLLLTLFSIVIPPVSQRIGLLWPFFALAIVVFYLLAIIMQQDFYLLILLLLFVAAAVYSVLWSSRSGARLINSVFAVTLILLSLIAASLVPNSAQGNGSKFVNDTVFPSFRRTVVRLFPRFPLLYSVAGYGMSFDESKLGGRPNLVDSPILEVEGSPGELYYLRTRVFDTYNGTSWSMSLPNPDRGSSQTADTGFLSGTGKPSDNFISLSVMANSFYYIPYTLDTKHVYFEGPLPAVKSGGRETGYDLAGPLRSGAKVYLEQYEDGGSRTERIEATDRARNLQIPEDLPPELRTIANEIKRDTSSKAEILAKIEAFLAYNYTYSIDVDDFAYGREGVETMDFAYAFLFQDSTGYCVHFATSFILLARLSGIPARYATGFLTRIPEDTNTATVTGFSAHAWPEVWLDGSGWINWEATPAANANNYTITGDEWFFNLGIELDQATARQLEGLIGGNIAEGDAAGDGDAGFSVGMFFLILGSIAAAATASFLLIRFAFPAVRYFSNNRGRLYYSLKHLIRRLERRGIPNPSRIGWLEWSERIKILISGISAGDDFNRQADKMVNIVLNLTYGDGVWRPEAAEQFAAFKKQVLEGIKLRNKRQGY